MSRIKSMSARFMKMSFLFLMFLFVLYSDSLIASDAVTEQNLKDAILERKTFTTDQLNEMNLNQDQSFDVADIVKFLKMMKPTANFESFTSNADEGSTINVKVNFSPSFSGTLRYSVSGTAVNGTDYSTLTGTISVNASSVLIPITITDNQTVEDAALNIVLTISEGDGYVPGASATHTVYITDNDGIWNGTLETNGVDLHFQMKIVRSPSVTSGALVTDGYGIVPKNGTGTEWPASVSLTATTFNATTDQILVPANLTLTNVNLKRKLVFTANSVSPTDIRGLVTETVTCDSATQFNYSTTGTFTLLKQIPNIPPQQPTLVNAN